MLIMGNSHVSVFDYGIETDGEPVVVHWVGALRIDWFYTGHPAAQKVREEFAKHHDWKVLFIGNHDIPQLLNHAVQRGFDTAMEDMLNKYKAVFRELNRDGRLIWAIAVQQTDNIHVSQFGAKDVLVLAQDFNRQLQQWCEENDIMILDPLAALRENNWRVPDEYVQADKLHLKPECAELYLKPLSNLTGRTMQTGTIHYQEEFDISFEPASFASLLLRQLGLPTRKQRIDEESLLNVVCQFVSGMFQEKGFQAEVDADENYVQQGILDSLGLVEVYAFASKHCGYTTDFEIDLYQYQTLRMICTRVLDVSVRLPVYEDFVVSLSHLWDVNDSALLAAEQRIAHTSTYFQQKFEQALSIAAPDGVGYGIVLFWQALMMRGVDRQCHDQLLQQACSDGLRFPVSQEKCHYYLHLKESKATIDSSVYYPEQVSYIGVDGFIYYEKRDRPDQLKQMMLDLPMLRKKIEMNCLQEAGESIDTWMQEFSDVADLLFLKALWSYHCGDIQATEQQLKQVFAIWPYHADGYLLESRLYRQTKDHERALQSLKQAERIDPKLTDFRDEASSLASVYYGIKRIIGGESFDGSVLATDRHTDSILSATLLMGGRGDKASDEEIQSHQKESASEICRRGEASFQRGDIDSAEACFMRAVLTDSGFVDGYNNLGVVWLHRGDIGKALEYFAKGFSIDPCNRDLVINAAEALKVLGKQKDVSALYEGYLAHSPGDDPIADLLKELNAGVPGRPKNEDSSVSSAEDQTVRARSDVTDPEAGQL